jgi:hypothetical protein
LIRPIAAAAADSVRNAVGQRPEPGEVSVRTRSDDAERRDDEQWIAAGGNHQQITGSAKHDCASRVPPPLTGAIR